MPNQRAAGQKQVIVVMKGDFLRLIDENLEAMGFSDRSQFIRKAVLERLRREGYAVAEDLATAPSRAGKGGRRKLPKVLVVSPKTPSREGVSASEATGKPAAKKLPKVSGVSRRGKTHLQPLPTHPKQGKTAG